VSKTRGFCDMAVFIVQLTERDLFTEFVFTRMIATRSWPNESFADKILYDNTVL